MLDVIECPKYFNELIQTFGGFSISGFVRLLFKNDDNFELGWLLEQKQLNLFLIIDISKF